MITFGLVVVARFGGCYGTCSLRGFSGQVYGWDCDLGCYIGLGFVWLLCYV